MPKRIRHLVLLVFVLGLFTPVYAHVKWFVDFSFTDPPRSLDEVLTPTFIILSLLSLIFIGVLVFIDRRINTLQLYQRIVSWLEERKGHASEVMRIGAGVVLLLSWQADALYVPELKSASSLAVNLQFVLALLLMFRQTTPLAGLGMMGLYMYGIFEFSPFHMLDYLLFFGVGYYLFVTYSTRLALQATRIPALYFTIGFSLCWVALEKVIYPQWGIYILEQNPILTLGINQEVFLLIAAFIEFALGYLLIIGLLDRPIALLVTLVFFTTTLIFGKVEIIGHFIIHASLIVFLLEGPGELYPAPIAIHKRVGLRTAFASINFIILLAVMLVVYVFGAQQQHQYALETETAQSLEMTAIARSTIIEQLS